MDAEVIAAMARWPNVPNVYDWLSLDRRGQWRLKGKVITHPGTRAFINRNYQCDARGAWFFQNGPQRVFIALEYAPWVLHLTGNGSLETHTGLAVTQPSAAFFDEEGNLSLATEHGWGLICDRDLAPLSARLCDANGAPPSETTLLSLLSGNPAPLTLSGFQKPVPVLPIVRAELPSQGAFIPTPQP